MNNAVVTASAAEVDAATQLPAKRLPHRVINRKHSTRRRWMLISIALAFVGLLVVLDARLTASIAMGVLIFTYSMALGYRLWLLTFTINEGGQVHVPDAVASELSDRDLPVYTLLIPAYGEPRVIGKLLAAIGSLDYPAHKLDVKLLLEADDQPTIRAVMNVKLAHYIEVVLVPPGEPRTKPKALNVGLLRARGEFVTVYDAEDEPEPLQLRRAVAAFHYLDANADSGRSSVACLQARLEFFNHGQNTLTRWFTIEYLTWFAHILPALAARELPIPLGGTSNHFRRDVLDEVGGWDPYNVTEDADLGLRLRHLGYAVDVLDSVTAEEANGDFVNWIRQRSRWHKGYIQTAAVYLRRPRETIRTFGVRGFVSFLLIVGCTPLLSLVNPIVWALTLMWIVARPAWIHSIFVPVVYHAGLFCLVVGNAALIYMGIVGTRASRRRDLLLAAITFPAYWLLMSVATIKGVIQLLRHPSYWEKTVHGLAPPDSGPSMSESVR